MPVRELEARLNAALDQDRPFGEVVRDLLGLVSEATGLSTTYLARAHMREDEQEILYSHNPQDGLFVPEDIKLPWSEGVCSFVHDGRAPEFTDNVPRDIPDSTVARMMGYRSFLSLPVFRRGQFYGTLCGCSARPVKVSAATLELIRKCANRIGELLPDDED
jgi:GAF domain-containing protein